MKKIVAALLSVVMLFALVACGENKVEKPSDSEEKKEEQKQEEKEEEPAAFVKPSSYAAAVYLKAGVELNIYIDEETRVIIAEPLNDVAKELPVSLSNIQNMKLENAVKGIVSGAVLNETIQPDSEINIYIDAAEMSFSTAITASIIDAIQTQVTELGLNITVTNNAPVID